MNVGRWILGGIVAGIVYFIGDGVVHGVLLKQHWASILGAINVDAEKALKTPQIFGIYDLVKGLIAVWIYAGIAGIVTWAAAIPLPLIGLIPMKFFSAGFVALWSAYAIVPMIIGAVVGAWLYREDATATSPRR